MLKKLKRRKKPSSTLTQSRLKSIDRKVMTSSRKESSPTL